MIELTLIAGPVERVHVGGEGPVSESHIFIVFSLNLELIVFDEGVVVFGRTASTQAEGSRIETSRPHFVGPR